MIAVDQFEELFTACRDEAERAAFADALVAAVRDPRRRALVLIALRADFYGRCAALPGAVADARRQPRAGRADAPRRAAARDRAARPARRPARRAGARRRADRRRRGRARRAAAAVDRAARAVAAARRARACASPPTSAPAACAARSRGWPSAPTSGSTPEQRPRRAAILLRLAGVGEGERGRAPAACRSPSSSARRARPRCSPTLADGRLVTRQRATRPRSPTRRCCASGRGCASWLEEDAEGRRLHHHLGVAAREWDARGRDPGELYRGARLAAALDWAAGHDPELDDVERAFLDESRAAERRARSAACARVLAGVAALLVLAVVAGRRRARAARQRARRGDRRRRPAARRRARWLETTSTARCCSPARASRSTTRPQTRGNLLGRAARRARRRSASCAASASASQRSRSAPTGARSRSGTPRARCSCSTRGPAQRVATLEPCAERVGDRRARLQPRRQPARGRLHDRARTDRRVPGRLARSSSRSSTRARAGSSGGSRLPRELGRGGLQFSPDGRTLGVAAVRTRPRACAATTRVPGAPPRRTGATEHPGRLTFDPFQLVAAHARAVHRRRQPRGDRRRRRADRARRRDARRP